VIDNGIVGQPSISCDNDAIRFSVQTEKPFYGKVYVKGEYNRAECIHSFSSTQRGGQHLPSDLPSHSSSFQHPQPEDHLQCPPCPMVNCIDPNIPRARRDNSDTRRDNRGDTAQLIIKLGTCNARRDRTISPPGVHVSFTVVVSFHENFITKVDRAYRIQCAYMEAEKTVKTEIDVSMPQTTELTHTITGPVCEYSIRSRDGQLIHAVKVGDIVQHSWECRSQSKGIYAMLVHDCFAEDGQGFREPVIDQHGCSLDRFVIPTPTYDTEMAMATVDASVFKFPDRTVLDFQCSISVCLRDDEECRKTTPPKCDHGRKRRSSVRHETRDGEWSIHAQTLTVIDLDEDLDKRATAELEQLRLRWPTVTETCISIAAFGVLIASSTFIFTLAIAGISALVLLRK